MGEAWASGVADQQKVIRGGQLEEISWGSFENTESYQLERTTSRRPGGGPEDVIGFRLVRDL